MESIHVRMLGEFSLRCGEVTISDNTSRSRKTWGLLAYLIYHRDQSIPHKKLMDLFWSGSANPENALRITLHRLRTLLDQLFPGAGRQLILYKDSHCGWNSQYPITLDCDRFETLALPSQQEEAQRLEQLQEALELYRGEFLPQLSSEIWVIPICAHFQNKFLQITLEAARLLSARQQYPEAANLCRHAIASEPYHEKLHQMLMQILSAAGDHKGAAAVYETLNKRLHADFGIRPSEETRTVYHATVRRHDDRPLPMEEVLAQLKEPMGPIGAMLCDYDSFKLLCYAESRDMERSKNPVHIALLNITAPGGSILSKRSNERIMEQLGQILRENLHQGDIISRCSASQYIILLPGANYENSCMICRRAIGAFTRAHPHAAAELHFMIQPLTPSVCVP